MVVLGLGFFIWQSINPTSSRLEYINNNQKFSFKYPKDWELKKTKDESTGLNLYLQKIDEDEGQYDIYVTVFPNHKKLSAQELYLDNFVESTREGAKKDLKKVEFGGLSGVEYQEGLAPANYSATAVLLTKGDKVFRFIYTPTTDENSVNKYLNNFFSILQSLKFY